MLNILLLKAVAECPLALSFEDDGRENQADLVQNDDLELLKEAKAGDDYIITTRFVS